MTQNFIKELKFLGFTFEKEGSCDVYTYIASRTEILEIYLSKNDNPHFRITVFLGVTDDFFEHYGDVESIDQIKNIIKDKDNWWKYAAN